MTKSFRYYISFIAIICIGGIFIYNFVSNDTFIINKYINNCLSEAPSSPKYCKCMAYFDHEFNKDIFKGLAHADRIAQKAILQALSKEKYEQYQDKIKYCRQFLSDEDYLASLDYTLQNSEICAREAFYKLPENTRWYLKSENTDAEKLEIKRNFFANLTTECMDNLDSEDELRKKLVFSYFIVNKKLPFAAFEKCIATFSAEELKLFKKADPVVLAKFNDCVNKEDAN